MAIFCRALKGAAGGSCLFPNINSPHIKNLLGSLEQTREIWEAVSFYTRVANVVSRNALCLPASPAPKVENTYDTHFASGLSWMTSSHCVSALRSFVTTNINE